MAAMELTRTHRILIGVVVAGAVVIAGIGFAGSYAAVRTLALQKGFGSFSLVFPIGIDAGICVLLALDLLLTWMRIPFPLLRQTAWLLTAATIAFNGAASWPDPLGVGMHAVIPILFVVTVEAARHAVGRIADITADRHMEGVRITRWLLSPIPTFKLWRRMKLWELRSYEQAVAMEQDRLIYQARLQARYGRAWRRKAPVASLMPLRLARIGVPLSDTAPEGLAAAGIEPALLPPAQLAQPAVPQAQPSGAPALEAAGARAHPQPPAPAPDHPRAHAHPEERAARAEADGRTRQHPGLPAQAAAPGPAPAPHAFAVDPTAMPAAHNSAWFAAPLAPQAAYEGGYNPQYVEGLEPTPVMPPAGPEDQWQEPEQEHAPDQDGALEAQEPHAVHEVHAVHEDQEPHAVQEGPETSDEAEFAEIAYKVFCDLVDEKQDWPSAEALDIHLSDGYGVTHPRSGSLLRRMIPAFKQRHHKDRAAEHIA
ncbi:hypothetical protein GCM10010371_12590 [Streptomyces subrutilus]|uniref:DUF2637 domain-containing protein n=2 Tax=Streptomyces subrutilus TaxID=36818 RepID=A0A5P2ULY1_9ACTN|nr:DUF2637 domain-containing protein [Streptomyces subrutilus]QEU79419.1 DUF2637 domain-containing protein [Streptomyces subrutilus]GGZ54408.1 hypothetical protein GCM10010371_12590 [Streptomyces subrutilus]